MHRTGYGAAACCPVSSYHVRHLLRTRARTYSVRWTCSRTGSVFGKEYIPAEANGDVRFVGLHRLYRTYIAKPSYLYGGVPLSKRTYCAEEYLPKNGTCP